MKQLIRNENYFINRNFLWIDLLYTKLSTENYLLLNENHKQFYLNGIDMLIFQAIESINIWLRKDIHKNAKNEKWEKYIKVKQKCMKITLQ